MSDRKCIDCSKDIDSRRVSVIRCKECSILRRNSLCSLSPQQQQLAIELCSTMTRDKIARQVGVSLTYLNRFYKSQNLKSNSLRYKEDVINRVVTYYKEHGLSETVKEFKDVNVNSILNIYRKRVNTPK
jgi:hypothetical protein